MKPSYFAMVGLLCSVFGSEVVYAKTPEEVLKKKNIQVASPTNNACPASYYPSKYLDKKYYSGAMHCYKCISPTSWHKDAYKCM